jgi:hypothetical protein
VLRGAAPWGGVEERRGRGLGGGCRGGVVIHPRRQARAVVQEVELAGDGVGVGYARLPGEGGEQNPHPAPVRLGGVLHGAASGDGLAILVTDGRAEGDGMHERGEMETSPRTGAVLATIRSRPGLRA